jgi:hypothetical protein
VEYLFTCTCKCAFVRYVKTDAVQAACPSCKSVVPAAPNVLVNGLPQVTLLRRQFGSRPSNIIPDITEFKSPVDNTVVGSRSALREHNKRNDVIQVGNDKFPKREERAPMTRAGYEVKRALDAARS